MKYPAFIRCFKLSSCSAAMLLTVSCGGGTNGAALSADSANATATGGAAAGAQASSATLSPSASTMGTVTGFGSVIVDGRRIDDHAVSAQVETDDGSLHNAELKLGHHVEIMHDDNLVASQVRITAEVRGQVRNLDLVSNTLTVLGQNLIVNTTPSAGPVTIFEAPYTQLSDLRAGDTIEAHALIRREASGAMTLQATRIERHAAGEIGFIRGMVAALSTSSRAFRLGGLVVSYDNATVTPAASALANNAEVVVWIPANATDAAVAATAIRVKDHQAASGGHETQLAGPVSAVDPLAKSFIIDGVLVDASKAALGGGQTLSLLATGTYVRVKGTFSGATLQATAVTLPSTEHAAGRETELHGTVIDFVSNASFNVRGVHVDASHATITCPGAAVLSENTQVEIDGRALPSGTLVAAEVKCEATVEDRSVVERVGQVSAVDSTARKLTLGTGPTALLVQWSAATVFVGVDQGDLNSGKIEVEGTLQANVLTATKIKREDT